MNQLALATIERHAVEGARLRESFFASNAEYIVDTALQMAVTLARGNKILLCGNGGSAADAQHLAAEFVNRFLMERPPLPAIALTTDSSILTAIGNDFGFVQVFSKQVLALGAPGDMLVAISTSGKSENIILALEAAHQRSMKTLGITGKGGGGMFPHCDLFINVEHNHTPLIQEIHIAVGHLLCELTDHFLFENVAALAPHLPEGEVEPVKTD